ncbi:MAG: hypothetical protein GEU79_16480 [Acidimicrobiia bacterium]|nr:hypothetical protein [Acidimicrobiia bacterium]
MAARAWMSASKTLPSSSVKTSSEEAFNSRPRTKKAAISPRVTDSSGQNLSLVGGLHPMVIPSAAIASISASWTLLSSSTNRPAALAEVDNARTIVRQTAVRPTKRSTESLLSNAVSQDPVPIICLRGTTSPQLVRVFRPGDYVYLAVTLGPCRHVDDGKTQEPFGHLRSLIGMTRAKSLFVLAVALSLMAVGCGSGSDESDPTSAVPSAPGTTGTDETVENSVRDNEMGGDGMQVLMADAERSRPSTDAPVGEVVRGSNGAGFELLRQLGVGDENLVFSPASLSIAFAMANAGADEETAAQLAEVFGFPPGDETHEAMNALLRSLEPDNANDPADGAETVMSVANSGWAQTGAEIGSDFLDTLAAQYGSGLHVTDFTGDTERSRQAVNGWIDEQTRGLIPELIAEGQLDPNTVYTLINALYFKAAWTHTFDEEATEPRPFTLSDESTVEVPMMVGDRLPASYVVDGNLTAISLSYGDGEFEMKVVMPEELGEFVDTLDADRWSQLASSFQKGEVNLTIPKWETESNLNLNGPLSGMGLEIPGGRYPGIMPGTWVASVLQGAKITVDETGTEAAAATAVMMATSAPVDEPEPVDITIDRPFFYTIEHVPTGLVLFAGQVVDPG